LSVNIFESGGEMRLSIPFSGELKFRGLLFLFIILALNSCEYDTNEIYNRNVDQNPQAPDVSLSDPDFIRDTLYQYGSYKIFNLTFKTNDQAIIGAGFLIDGGDSVFVKPVNGKIPFDLYLTEGIHTLTIEPVTRKGSSSIADILGMEGFGFKRTWIILVDNTPMDYFKKEVIKGYARLSLRKYRAPDLKEYEIRKFNAHSYVSIGKSNSPWFTDSTYVGEPTTYQVIVNKTNGESLIWNEFQIKEDIPSLHFSLNTGGYYIWWNKVKYFNAVDKYSIQHVLGMSYYIDDIKTSFNNPNDTTLSLPDVHPGDVCQTWLKVIPKPGNVLYQPDYYFEFTDFEIYNARYPKIY
jgi:hypothetical protein